MKSASFPSLAPAIRPRAPASVGLSATASSTPTLPALRLPAMTNTDAKMQLAIAAVVAGSGLSVREAARRYGVPRTTLQRKLSKDSAAAGAGGASVATPEEASSATKSEELASPASSSPDDGAVARAHSLSTPATTPSAADAAVIANAFDATQSSMSSILSLYESNGNGTSAAPASSYTSRKRPIDALSAPNMQQPPLRKGGVCVVGDEGDYTSLDGEKC